MSFAAPLSALGLAIIVVAMLSLAWLAYGRPTLALTARQRWTLAGLRFAALLLLLLFLMRPVYVRTAPDPTSAIVPILLDVSQSMGLPDVDGESRLTAAKSVVRSGVLPALEGRFQSELLAFGQDVAPISIEGATPNAVRSDLRGALDRVRQRYAGRSVAGLVLLSDGAETGGANPSSDWRPPFPVYAVGFGAQTVRVDREVSSVAVGRSTLADSLVDLTATVVSHGLDAPFDVRVLQDGQLAHSRTVQPSADGTPLREVFRVSPKAEAPTRYTVDVVADPAEATSENNRRSALVPAAGRPRRVLMIEGGPGFEHTFVKRALELDRQIHVDSVTRKGENAQGAPSYLIQADPDRGPGLANGFPTTKAALFEYDGIVVSSVRDTEFTPEQLTWLVQFVGDRGGGLLVMGAESLGANGFAKTVLNDILPLDLSERSSAMSAPGPLLANRVSLTDEGAGHPIMQLASTPEATRRAWAEKMPALGNSVVLGSIRPAAQVLAVTAGASGVVRPLVAVQPYGRGRTAIFSGEGAWRWRMQLPSTDQSYEVFWRQFSRWLANESPEPVAVRATPSEPNETSRVVIEVRTPEHEPVTDAHVAVTATDPGGTVEELAATLTDPASGIYSASWTPRSEGVYRFQATAQWGESETQAASAVTLVGGQSREFSDPRRHTDVLQRLADESSGKVVERDDIGRLSDWLSERATSRQMLVRRELWHHPVSWLLLAGCLSTEWVLRRRWGLR